MELFSFFFLSFFVFDASSSPRTQAFPQKLVYAFEDVAYFSRNVSSSLKKRSCLRVRVQETPPKIKLVQIMRNAMTANTNAGTAKRSNSSLVMVLASSLFKAAMVAS